MRVLVCLDEVPASDGTCTTQAWVEQLEIPPMSIEDAQQIASSAFLAFASVMAVKIALRKSQ